MRILLDGGYLQLACDRRPFRVATSRIVLTVLGAGRASSSAHLLTLVTEAGTLWYLLSPRVRELFEPNWNRTEI